MKTIIKLSILLAFYFYFLFLAFYCKNLALAILSSISGKMPPSPNLLFQFPWLLLKFKAQNFTVCFKLAYFYYLSFSVYLEAHLEKSQFV